jgi:uncharacterized small protein (DUF1192 family)
MVNITTTATTFREQEQKTRQGSHVAVIEIEVAIKALDRHIERLQAKLSFLVRSYDNNNNNPRTDLSDQYEKKIATLKQEIDDMMEHRRQLVRRRLLPQLHFR